MSVGFKGPIVGSADAMGGALEGVPLNGFNRSRYVSYFNDFLSPATDFNTLTDWDDNPQGSGSTSVAGASTSNQIGILRLDVTAANQGPIVNHDGGATGNNLPMCVLPTAAVSGVSLESDAVFYARARAADAANSGCFVGLAEHVNTSAILATNAGNAINGDNALGFHIRADSTLSLVATGTAAANVVTHTGPTVGDNQWFEIAVRATGTDRYAGYVRLDGADVFHKVGEGTMSTGWDAALVITFGVLGGGSGDDLDIDFCGFCVKRSLTA